MRVDLKLYHGHHSTEVDAMCVIQDKERIEKMLHPELQMRVKGLLEDFHIKMTTDDLNVLGKQETVTLFAPMCITRHEHIAIIPGNAVMDFKNNVENFLKALDDMEIPAKKEDIPVDEEIPAEEIEFAKSLLKEIEENNTKGCYFAIPYEGDMLYGNFTKDFLKRALNAYIEHYG